MSGGIWMPGRNRKDCPLSKLKSILNKITEDKFLPLSLEIKTLFDDRITEDEQLEECAVIILEKAIIEPTYCHLHAQLCFVLGEERKSFKKKLLNKCQSTFQEILISQKISRGKRLLGCIQIIGEIYNINLIPSKIIFCDVAQRLIIEKSDSSVEALCLLFGRIGKKLQQHSILSKNLDLYINILTKLQKDQDLTSRTRFLIMDILDLKKAKWEKK